ncbi:putative UDP-sugar transporter protein SLC35A4 [Tubulanus polymorphus]|uniref:putative UDP-sugar transporter protein SLC35A4 n=1 Tax=Tubulanus polymorphus TaxID=672921 RepID=UPI003DA4156B
MSEKFSYSLSRIMETKVQPDDVEKGQNELIKEPVKPFSPLVWKLLLLVGVILYGSYTILVHLCEVDGKIPFSSASQVLLTEFSKLMLSICMFIPEAKAHGFTMPTLRYALPFSVPAVLYLINNNLGIHMQTQMDPATYQVLGNFKILSTAFLYRLIIKRPISPIQWVSLGILAVAGICNSYGGLQAKPLTSSAGVVHITLQGLIMISGYCFISGMSGVYCEYVLKRHYQMSIHIQNALLYSFGILLNGSSWFIGVVSSEDGSFNLIKGFSIYTWAIVISQTFAGLIMSAIMKHASNITRLFLISTAMVVTTILSMIIFNLQLNTYFCISFVLVIGALAMYHKT